MPAFVKVILKTTLKIVVSGVALYLVFRKTDLNKLIEIIYNVKWIWLAAALVVGNISQWASSYRLQYIFKSFDIHLSYFTNLRLYYKGMFYNLFLPGGIGGDGAKTVIIHRKFKKPVKDIIGGLFIDRLTGLSAMVLLGLTGLLLFRFQFNLSLIKYLIFVSIILLYPAFYIFLRLFFKKRSFPFLSMCGMGLLTNIIQTFVVLLIFQSIGIRQMGWEYLTVFYIANIALVLPVTIGGIGGRELVFLYAPLFTPIDANLGITFSLLFFLQASVSSLIGGFINVD